MSKITQLRAAEAKLTAAPWHAVHGDRCRDSQVLALADGEVFGTPDSDHRLIQRDEHDDAESICVLRNALPSLLSVVEAAMAWKATGDGDDASAYLAARASLLAALAALEAP